MSDPIPSPPRRSILPSMLAVVSFMAVLVQAVQIRKLEDRVGEAEQKVRAAESVAVNAYTNMMMQRVDTVGNR